VYYFEENEELIKKILEEISPELPKLTGIVELDPESKIAGKSFCVTGSFE